VRSLVSSACNLFCSGCNLCCSACNLCCSACNLCCSAFNLQFLLCNLWCSACNLHFLLYVQPAFFALRAAYVALRATHIFCSVCDLRSPCNLFRSVRCNFFALRGYKYNFALHETETLTGPLEYFPCRMKNAKTDS